MSIETPCEVKTAVYDRGEVAVFFISPKTTTEDREYMREQWLGQDAKACWFRDTPRVRALLHPFRSAAKQ